MNHTDRRTRFALVWVVLPAMVVGCAKHVEQWDAFDVDWDKHLKSADERRAKNTDAFAPAVNNPPDLPALDGDGPIALSLEQATLLAMRNNRDLAVQQLNPVIAGTFEQIERGVFDPEFFAEANFSDETANETARSTGEQFSVRARDVDAAAGIARRLPTGTTVEGTIAQDRSTSNRAPEQQEARLGLTVTQSLLRGFGPAVNLARIRQARQETVASQYELRGFTEALLAEVEIAYWQYVLAVERIAILEQSLNVATQQADDIQRQIDVGALAEIESAAALAEVAFRKQALIDGRSDLGRQRLRLLRLLDPAGGGRFNRAVAATTPPRIEPKPIDDAEARVKLAEQHRPDLNEARARLIERRLETIVTRNGVLPKLDVFIAVGKTGFGDTFSQSFKELDGNTWDFTAGLRFNQLLSNRSAKARDRAALVSRQQAAAAVNNLRHLVALDVRIALNQVDRARQQIAATRTTRELQAKSADAEKQRFDAGKSTSLDVARAQRDLLETQIAEVEAVVRYRVELVRLYLAEGSLLDRRGVVTVVDHP